MYRRTEPSPSPPPPPKLKANSKKGKAAARASKRRKTQEHEESANDADCETPAAEDEGNTREAADDGFGGRNWECIAVSLSEYQDFLDSIRRSKDPDEKVLHQRITEDVLPIIEKAEESQLRRKQKQERELMNIQKLATAKRSSRLEAKFEKERQEQEAVEAERKKHADLLAAKQDQEKQKKMEEARESRMMTREQRIKEREYKRILHEEELANLSEENKKVEAGEARLSERHLKMEMEKQKKELAALAEYDEWIFDCSKCGVHGTNLVCTTFLLSSKPPLTGCRTMVRTALLARNAMYGSTVLVWVFRRPKPRRTTSISFVMTARGEKKMRRSPKFQASNFTSALRRHHHQRNPRLSFLERTKGKRESLVTQILICHH